MQTRAWGRHKSSWRWEAILARDEAGEIKGSLAVMIRKVPGMPYSMMYGCRGPVCDENDLETAKELFEGAKKLAKELRCYILKLDPDIRSDRADFAALMAELGFTLPPDTSRNSRLMVKAMPHNATKVNAAARYSFTVLAPRPEASR